MLEVKAVETEKSEGPLRLKDEDELRLLVGMNADYYLDKWNFIEKTGNTVVLNLWSLIFGLFWMVYRKMYLYALIAYIFMSLVFVIKSVMKQSIFVNYVSFFVFGFFFAFFGNYIYYVHTRNKLAKLRKDNLLHEDIDKKLKILGGTSWVSVIVLFVLLIGAGFVWSHVVLN